MFKEFLVIFVAIFAVVPTWGNTWDNYIDNMIAQSKDASGVAHIDKACIIGLDGGSKWTTDAHANVS